ncbi:MAG: hypothetical protein NTY34_06955 [Candidatus Omnitrophica bacterium]|nr:hypothetical protein [Candidatus Omnitrophota bacterium]
MMETRTDNIIEKRRFQRVGSNLPLRYKNIKTATVPMGSITKDIGAGGISFKTNEFISLACRLVVEVTLPTVQRPIKAISKVAWVYFYCNSVFSDKRIGSLRHCQRILDMDPGN